MAKAAVGEKALAKEYETYQSKLPELVALEGKFVLIQDEHVVGCYATYQEALEAGYEKFGLNRAFLVKQVRAVETPVFLG